MHERLSRIPTRRRRWEDRPQFVCVPWYKIGSSLSILRAIWKKMILSSKLAFLMGLLFLFYPGSKRQINYLKAVLFSTYVVLSKCRTSPPCGHTKFSMSHVAHSTFLWAIMSFKNILRVLYDAGNNQRPKYSTKRKRREAYTVVLLVAFTLPVGLLASLPLPFPTNLNTLK